MIDQLQHERKWSEKLLTESYQDFLTADEIKSILDNKDIWMEGEEVVERLKKKMEILEEEAKKAEEIAKAEEAKKAKPIKPKAPIKRAKKV